MNIKQKLTGIRLPIPLGLLAIGLLLLAAGAGHAQDKRPAETSTPNEFLNTLSEQERAWLRAHPVISVAQDPSWPPIEFTDERGMPSGITADYLSLVEKRLGMKFQRVKNLSWQEAYARMKRWEVDMTTTVASRSTWPSTKTSPRANKRKKCCGKSRRPSAPATSNWSSSTAPWSAGNCA